MPLTTHPFSVVALHESVSILATANLTYELGLTDFKFVGREHTLGIGGTIGYAFTGSLCAPIVAQVFVLTVECLLWHHGRNVRLYYRKGSCA